VSRIVPLALFLSRSADWHITNRIIPWLDEGPVRRFWRRRLSKKVVAPTVRQRRIDALLEIQRQLGNEVNTQEFWIAWPTRNSITAEKSGAALQIAPRLIVLPVRRRFCRANILQSEFIAIDQLLSTDALTLGSPPASRPQTRSRGLQQFENIVKAHAGSARPVQFIFAGRRIHRTTKGSGFTSTSFT